MFIFDQDLPYEPKDLTEPDQQHHTRSILDDKSDVQLPQLNDLYVEKLKSAKEPLENVVKYCDLTDGKVHSNRRSPNECSIAKEIDELPEIPRTERRMNQEVSEKPGENNTIPLIPAACNFQAARRMAQENLEHQPLPDSIMERAYLKLQAQGFTNPELALDVEPRVTGVGVRTHNAGPTHCTKLKVYRPKTCGVVPPPLKDPNYRPQTAFVPKTKIEPMDLAICWDYRPANPLDEPKLPAHIDGSDDTVAPAVFSVVKTPRPIEVNNTSRSAGVFSHTAGEEGFFDKDIMLRNRNYFSAQLEKNTDRSCKCSIDSRSRSATRRALQEQECIRTSNRCKSSPNLSLAVQPTDCSPKESIIVCNYNKEHYHYRPESIKCQKSSRKEIKNNQTSRLCERNVSKLNHNNNDTKPEFKCAFKAGIPRSHSSGFCGSFESTSNIGSSTGSEFTSKIIRIPKPIHPYKYKNYNIDTLAPPFACWKGGAGQGGYPEHCRLTSVYQHAYKPIKQRKRPLLATVFQ